MTNSDAFYAWMRIQDVVNDLFKTGKIDKDQYELMLDEAFNMVFEKVRESEQEGRIPLDDKRD